MPLSLFHIEACTSPETILFALFESKKQSPQPPPGPISQLPGPAPGNVVPVPAVVTHAHSHLHSRASDWAEPMDRGRPSDCRQHPSLSQGSRMLLWHPLGALPRPLPQSTEKLCPGRGAPPRGPQGHHSLILDCHHTFSPVWAERNETKGSEIRFFVSLRQGLGEHQYTACALGELPEGHHEISLGSGLVLAF